MATAMVLVAGGGMLMSGTDVCSQVNEGTGTFQDPFRSAGDNPIELDSEQLFAFGDGAVVYFQLGTPFSFLFPCSYDGVFFEHSIEYVSYDLSYDIVNKEGSPNTEGGTFITGTITKAVDSSQEPEGVPVGSIEIQMRDVDAGEARTVYLMGVFEGVETTDSVDFAFMSEEIPYATVEYAQLDDYWLTGWIDMSSDEFYDCHWDGQEIYAWDTDRTYYKLTLPRGFVGWFLFTESVPTDLEVSVFVDDLPQSILEFLSNPLEGQITFAGAS